jgi:hypothetical protein
LEHTLRLKTNREGFFSIRIRVDSDLDVAVSVQKKYSIGT